MRSPHAHFRTLLIVLIIASVSPFAWSDSPTTVAQWIEKLGSESYATRVRAREALQRIGLEAFDELQIAQDHNDGEIALTARHLVSSLLVSWSKPTDSDEVRQTLHEYGAQSFDERQSRIDLLSEMPDRKGLAALVRLTRFETDPKLSRYAALAILRQPTSDLSAQRNQNAEEITMGLQGSTRAASDWLRAFADDLRSGGYDVKRWNQLVDAQRRILDTTASQHVTRSSILELVRVIAKHAQLSNKNDAALRLATENLDLIAPSTQDLLEACNWAIESNLHPIVLELQTLNEKFFSEQPMLLYSAAEAHQSVGETESAQELADRAIGINPLPGDKVEREKMSPKALQEIAQAHREMGVQLKSRGLYDWAEREFRLIIDNTEVDSTASASARDFLAQMLGELNRHQEVVDVLTPLVERIDNDDLLKDRLNSLRFTYDRMNSDIQWHGAQLKIDQGDIEGAKPMLEKAYQLYPMNIDILISMFRLKQDDPKWTAKVDVILDQTIRRTKQEIDNIEQMLKQPGVFNRADSSLAQSLNQYAWLVSNTKGDFRQALKYSQRSLEISPDDSALMDTCARCYYAIGDLENATKMQRKAVKLEPHSPPMIRQLEQFEEELGKLNKTAE